MTSRLFRLAAVMSVAVLLATIVLDARQASHQHNHAGVQPVRQTTVTPMKPTPAGVALPALPAVNFQPPMPMAVVRQVYEFAARHPEVLQYIPCYCGCERVGHGGNHDCFVKTRAANGRIVEWDSHGIGCAICLDVGRRSMAMFNSGMTVPAIRAAIDKEYGTRFPSQTPTPQPPKAATKKS